MISEKVWFNLNIAFEAITANKVRSILTALGIIFGVAAVIAMLAIGNGAKKEILEQIKLVGVNNIVITPVEVKEEEEAESSKTQVQNAYSPGLTLADVESIKQVIPDVSAISPEIIINTHFIKNGISSKGKVVGVNPEFFQITNFEIEQGSMFNEAQLVGGEPVCIIGKQVKQKFFNSEDPIGKYLKCGTNWLKVIGVINEKKISESSKSNLGIRDYNTDVYTPLKTVLLRYRNRALITKASLFSGSEGDEEEGVEQPQSQEDNQFHQLDRLVVQIRETDKLTSSSEILGRLMNRKHNGVKDFEITVPELLLKQQQRTKDIFNIVLGAIAGISLLVGGIGIMNIMLASVLERIKEIGLRLSIGATKKDIVQQFVFESVLISLTGGLAGIVLGVVLSFLVGKLAGIETIISVASIIISFGVSATVGLVFGITPAKRAAEQDPIKSLRYE